MNRKPLRLDIGFLELFASANTQANTCAYLSLMRLEGSSITLLDQQSLSVFDETRWFYCLVGPGQPTMLYYSSVEGVSVFDETSCSSNNHYPKP